MVLHSTLVVLHTACVVLNISSVILHCIHGATLYPCSLTHYRQDTYRQRGCVPCLPSHRPGSCTLSPCPEEHMTEAAERPMPFVSKQIIAGLFRPSKHFNVTHRWTRLLRYEQKTQQWLVSLMLIWDKPLRFGDRMIGNFVTEEGWILTLYAGNYIQGGNKWTLCPVPKSLPHGIRPHAKHPYPRVLSAFMKMIVFNLATHNQMGWPNE